MKRKGNQIVCSKDWLTSQVYSSQVSENKLSCTNVKRCGLISILCNQFVCLDVSDQSTLIDIRNWNKSFNYKSKKIKIIYPPLGFAITTYINKCYARYYAFESYYIMSNEKMLCNHLMRGFGVHRFSFLNKT